MSLLLPTLASPAQFSATDYTQQAASHVIFSYNGGSPPSELITLAQQCALGGLILFGNNVNENVSSFITQLQDTYTGAGCQITAPLLIVTDQEGGEVVRLPGGPTMSEKEIGESSDPSSAASTAGSQAASALQAYNLNGNLTPVLDVFRQAGDFDDQYQRSYNSNASIVGECASAFISTQQGAGFAATAKHFPGLGAAAANQDTDDEPVTINLTLSELRSVDEVPYTSAIAAGVDMVMASWALYPALDATYPSGLSTAWIQQELRQRLGFTGVTMTDAIEAGALEAFGMDPGHRAVLASVAGMDLILASAQNVTQGQAVTSALAAALSAGALNVDDFNDATKRITALRMKLTK